MPGNDTELDRSDRNRVWRYSLSFAVRIDLGKIARGEKLAPNQGGLRMATYIVLGNYTDQGIRSIKDTLKRTDAVKALAKKSGVTLKESFWTRGAYDLVSIFEAPDDQSMTAFGLSIGVLGNVRTQTLRAFSAADMSAILGKVS
jgi:uncharacterized protein with GYD domain